MLFGERLKEVRIEKGITQKQLAEGAGTHQQSIARFETGERIPGADDLFRLCKALRVRATAFEDCTFGEVAEKRGRGRPKAEAAPAPEAKPKRKRKGGAE